MIPLLAVAAAGSAAADNAPVDVFGCAPITCAAQYIRVPTDELSARIVERQRAGRSLGIDTVLDMLDMLDTAEQQKLAAVTGPSLAANVFQVRQIMQDHDDLEDLVMTYLVSGVLPPQ